MKKKTIKYAHFHFTADCGDHELVVDCYSACSPRTCPDAINYPNGMVCPAICETDRCDCENGYLRNKCGVCTPAEFCSQSCECKSMEAEERRCVNDCSVRSCGNILSKTERNCTTDFCAEQCDCIEGYARNRFGECVVEERCKEFTE